MHGFCSKLVCLSKPAKVTDISKDASLLRWEFLTDVKCFMIQAVGLAPPHKY